MSNATLATLLGLAIGAALAIPFGIGLFAAYTRWPSLIKRALDTLENLAIRVERWLPGAKPQ